MHSDLDLNPNQMRAVFDAIKMCIIKENLNITIANVDQIYTISKYGIEGPDHDIRGYIEIKLPKPICICGIEYSTIRLDCLIKSTHRMADSEYEKYISDDYVGFIYLPPFEPNDPNWSFYTTQNNISIDVTYIYFSIYFLEKYSNGLAKILTSQPIRKIKIENIFKITEKDLDERTLESAETIVFRNARMTLKENRS
ncbi:MAG: hypothetical protein RIC18_00105 [Hoeflea sp.]|uniref:hypothetical protein n=1 Tax=Hoeflea sp. TaxID=1940281 RepID=UPI0032ECC867